MSATNATLPLPNVPAIYVHGPQGQQGPLPLDAILGQVMSGQLPPNAPIWFEGLSGWMPLADHPEIRARLAGANRPAPPPAALPSAPQPGAGGRADDELDRIFGNLIGASWKHFNANQFATHIDEVFIGAVITSTLDNGYSLIDLTSDGSNHYLRFENMQDHGRIIYQLHHLAHSPAEAKVLGHIANVTVGYGGRVPNLGRIWNALKAEYKSGYLQSPEPGTITIDADLESGYVYAQGDMIWNISDYIADDYATEHARLTEHIGACVHALRKYLHGRMA